MSDVIFKNTIDVLWHSTYDSYMVVSNVETDIGSGLTLGSTEVLAGTSNTISNVQVLLSFGVVEILASTIPTTSVSDNIELTMGLVEEISSGVIIGTTVDSFINLGVAEGVSSTSDSIVSIVANLSFGVVELLASTIATTSSIDAIFDIGSIELITSHNVSIVSVVSNPPLVTGVVELLSSSTIFEDVVSGFIILGTEEVIFSDCSVRTDVKGSLSFGIVESLSSTSNVIMSTDALITTGISELLSSSFITYSTTTIPELIIGIDEELSASYLVNSLVSAPSLDLGQPESLSSSITIISLVNNTFSMGVIEILGSASPITSVVLDSTLDIGGGIEILKSTSLVESSTSAFLTMGTTEPLSATIHITSFIRRGGSTWSVLTIGHVELLTRTIHAISNVNNSTLSLGITEELSNTNITKTNISGYLTIGAVELLASSVSTTSVAYDSELTIGHIESLSATDNLDVACSAFLLMGTTESLSTTINCEVSQTSLLLIGQVELLASTVFSISITDSDILIGGSEIQTGSASAQSNIYAVLITGGSEDLSSTQAVISTTSNSLLTTGIVEVLSTSLFTVSVVDADLELGEVNILTGNVLIQSSSISILTLGVTEKLSVTTNIVSLVSSELDLGIDELLNSSTLIQSLVTSVLTTGLSEELSSTINVVSDILSELTIGITEILLSTSTIVSSASSGLLITGELEILASTTFSVSITESELTMGVIEPLSSSISIESSTSGFIIQGDVENLTSKVNVVSFIRKGGTYSSLTIGHIEILEYTSPIISKVYESNLILGIVEPLSSTYYFLGSSTSSALLTTGKIEILAVTAISQSVADSDLTLGVDEPLSGTANATIEGGTITGVLTLGIDEELSSTINIVSVVDTDIVIGVIELLASTVATTSDVTLTMYVGIDEPLSTGCVVVSKVEAFINLGEAAQLTSTLNITTSITTDVYLGIIEQLSKNIDVNTSVSLPNLTIGSMELLTSFPYVQSIITANLGLGILEVVAASSTTQSNLPGELTLGVDEPLVVTNLIQSLVSADITMGADTPLSATINIESNNVSLLTIGTLELLATSNFSITIVDADISFGADESLSYSQLIQSVTTAELTMGLDTPISSSILITSYVGVGNLVLGVSELLASTNFSITITDAEISFGVDEPLSSSILIQSYTNDGPLIIGVDELLSSVNASTLSFPPAELTLGIGEILSATCHCQPTVDDVLNLGGDETLSYSILIQSVVENTIDLVIGGPVPMTATARAKVFARATYLYMPGALEELESTINIQSYTNALIKTDTEILTGTTYVYSNIVSELDFGIVELVASTISSISITGSFMEYGESEILESTVSIVSNVYNTEISFGVVEELSHTRIIPIVVIFKDTEDVRWNNFYNNYDLISIVTSTLTIGLVELLASSISSTASALDSELTLGIIELVKATTKSTTKTKGFLQIPGDLEILESTINVQSVVEPSGYELFVSEIILTGTIGINSYIDNTIIYGTPETLTAIIHCQSYIEQVLLIGVHEMLSSTITIASIVNADFDKPTGLISTVIATTNVDATYIVTGDPEELSSTCIVDSFVENAQMLTGDVTDITSTILITTELYVATLDLGIIEVLESTVNIVGIVNDIEIVFGLVELVSATFSIQTTVDDAYLIAPIIWASSSIDIVTNIYDTSMFVYRELTSTCSIESIFTGNIVPGIVELLSSTIIGISDTTSELDLGVIEILESTSVVEIIVDALAPINMNWLSSNVFADSEVAIIRLTTGLYSGVAEVKVTVSNVELTFGVDEVLTSTTNIVSNINVELLVGVAIELSSKADAVVNVTALDLVNNNGGNVIITSNVADAFLVFGAETGMTGHASTSSLVTGYEIIVGVATPMSSAINVVSSTTAILINSNFRGLSESEVECWAVLTLGVAEHFESGNAHVVSVVSNSDLIIGAIDFYGENIISINVEVLLEVIYSMKGISTIQSNVDVDLSIGGVTNLEHTSVIESIVSNAELTFGVIEILTAGGFIECNVDGFIYTGAEYIIRSDVHAKSIVGNADLFIGDATALFSQSNAKSLIITPYLRKGIVEELTSTVVIETITGSIQILIGLAELLSSSIFSISITDAELTTGIDSDLSATGTIVTSSSGHILIGITEILSSTSVSTCLIGLSDELYIGIALNASTVYNSIIPVSDIVVGSQESLSANISIRSSVNAEYIVGNHEPLLSSISLGTNAVASLDVGYAEHLSGSVIFSINMYDLELGGALESLSSTIHVNSRIDTFLNLGVANPLTSSLNIVQTVTTSDLIIGLVEVLSATTSPWVESNSDTLWLEIEHKSNVVVQSLATADIHMGHLDNSLSSSIVLGTVCTIDPMYLGEDEILNARSVIQIVVATELTLGVINEYVDSSIECISVVGTKTELDIDTIDRYVRRITADLQYWYDHFVVNHKTLNKHQIQFPSANNEYTGSFVELLFNDNFENNHYRYLYREIYDKSSWPDAIRTRMMLNPDTAHYYIADGDDPEVYTINVYDIQSHDIVMMDRLLVYRLEPQNATLVGIEYDNLDTALAKMIYIYLELKLTGDYSKYDNEAIFTTRVNSLETCYETYLTQSIFEHVSKKGT